MEDLALSAFYQCITYLHMFCSFLEHSNTNFEARNESRSCVVKLVKWLYFFKKYPVCTISGRIYVKNWWMHCFKSFLKWLKNWKFQHFGKRSHPKYWQTHTLFFKTFGKRSHFYLKRLKCLIVINLHNHLTSEGYN